MTDIWDDPELAGAMAGGDFVSFKDPNTVVGTFLSIDAKGGTDFNGNVCPLVVIEDDDGETRKITVGQAGLKAKLWDAKPRPGDRVAIGWDGETVKVDKGDMKVFTVEVKRAEAVAAEKPKSLL
jgi:hypothetical protein